MQTRTHRPARIHARALQLSNDVHNLNIVDRALIVGGESWLDTAVVLENIVRWLPHGHVPAQCHRHRAAFVFILF